MLLSCEDIPAIDIVADRDRVIQVLSNLIGNAIKFTQAGGTITLSARVEGYYIQFSVTDTGRGVSLEQIPRLFDRYWQAKTDGRLGIGLGLSIAKGIVEAHGGKIWVESELGKGDCVSLHAAGGWVRLNVRWVAVGARQKRRSVAMLQPREPPVCTDRIVGPKPRVARNLQVAAF